MVPETSNHSKALMRKYRHQVCQGIAAKQSNFYAFFQDKRSLKECFRAKDDPSVPQECYSLRAALFYCKRQQVICTADLIFAILLG